MLPKKHEHYRYKLLLKNLSGLYNYLAKKMLQPQKYTFWEKGSGSQKKEHFYISWFPFFPQLCSKKTSWITQVVKFILKNNNDNDGC